MKVVIFIVMFLVVGALIIISNNNFALAEDEKLSEFTELYVSWLNKVYLNLRVFTGEVISSDWLPE